MFVFIFQRHNKKKPVKPACSSTHTTDHFNFHNNYKQKWQKEEEDTCEWEKVRMPFYGAVGTLTFGSFLAVSWCENTVTELNLIKENDEWMQLE